MYKSPIEIITGNIQTQIDDEIYRAVQNVGINVDKEELLKALEYDRGQYEKGYNDAIDDFAEELKSILPIAVHQDCSEIDYAVDYALYNMRFKIDKIAEQLRAGEQEWIEKKR